MTSWLVVTMAIKVCKYLIMSEYHSTDDITAVSSSLSFCVCKIHQYRESYVDDFAN